MTRPEGGQLALRIVTSVSEIEEIREFWTAWQSNPTSAIDNFLRILRYRSEIQRPHVIVVYRDGHPDSILVGRLEHTRISFKIGYLKLFQPQVRVLCFMHGGFLGNQSIENSEYVTREIMRCLSRGEADVARLEFVRTDSSLYGAAKGVPGILCRDHVAPIQLHGCLRLPGSFEEFIGNLSRKERHNLRRQAKRLQADFPGGMRIQCSRQENQIEDL